jgi:hypothetical protein
MLSRFLIHPSRWFSYTSPRDPAQPAWISTHRWRSPLRLRLQERKRSPLNTRPPPLLLPLFVSRHPRSRARLTHASTGERHRLPSRSLPSRIPPCSASWTASPKRSAAVALTFRRDPTPRAGARRRQGEARRSGRSKSVVLCCGSDRDFSFG